MTGRTLGHYEIREPLGTGGMGEVYLAEDTRLGRKVAVKVLPPEFASDPDRLARFEQEARAAASLNHPHIAAVFDVGSESIDGETIHFIVQEYLEGEPLRAPLDNGSLPIRKAATLGAEVAAALAAAHAEGVVHRDLKPENIFVTREGHAKILDFGLAKLTEPAPSGTQLSMSPTMVGTVAGQVMGTAGYMAPEQVAGGEVDGRTDLFAFGCVLYEMLGGQRPFAGRSVHQTLDLIVNEEPQPLAVIAPELPATAHWMVRKCLAKDPDDRYQSAADLKVDLRALVADLQASVASGSVAGEQAAGAVARPRGGSGWSSTTVAVMAVVALAVGFTSGWLGTPAPPEPSATQKFLINLPEGTWLQGGVDRVVNISPDGQTIVFVAADETGYRVYRRRIDEYTATPIPDTEGGGSPFISPDNEWLAFESPMLSWIKKVPLWGIGVTSLCSSCLLGSWGEDDGILFSTLSAGELWRIGATGGDRRRVVSAAPEQGVQRQRRAEMLPGGDAVLFEINGERDTFEGIGVRSLVDDRFIRISEDGTDPFFAASGHIVFGSDGGLYAVAFDAETLTVTGEAARVVEDVRVEGGGAVQANVSRNGTLVYASGGGAVGTQLVRVDPDGARQLVVDAWRLYRRPEVSPDGRRIALTIQDGADNDLYVVDIAGRTLDQLSDRGDLSSAIWIGPESIAVGFSSPEGHGVEVLSTDRSSDSRTLATGTAVLSPESWNEAEARLIVSEGVLASGNTMLKEVGVSGEALADVAGSNAGEHSAVVSPDGRWLAYVGQRGDRREVYVRPSSASGGRVQVSVDGGFAPRWDPDPESRRLYYLVTDARSVLMSAEILDEPRLAAGERREMFPTHDFWNGVWGTNYAVHPDGYFLFLRQAVRENGIDQINVVVNWFEELNRRVPSR